jgi:hypothetical protein
LKEDGSFPHHPVVHRSEGGLDFVVDGTFAGIGKNLASQTNYNRAPEESR